MHTHTHTSRCSKIDRFFASLQTRGGVHRYVCYEVLMQVECFYIYIIRRTRLFFFSFVVLIASIFTALDIFLVRQSVGDIRLTTRLQNDVQTNTMFWVHGIFLRVTANRRARSIWITTTTTTTTVIIIINQTQRHRHVT